MDCQPSRPPLSLEPSLFFSFFFLGGGGGGDGEKESLVSTVCACANF